MTSFKRTLPDPFLSILCQITSRKPSYHSLRRVLSTSSARNIVRIDEITYTRGATLQAFRSYFHFLLAMYLDDSNIAEQPKAS